MWGLILACMGCSAARAIADGPVFYRLRESSGIKPTPLRIEPVAAAVVVGQLPAKATCIRNKGCQGLDLSDRPRWCKVEHQGMEGWIEGALLAEGACADPLRLEGGAKPQKVSGIVMGADTAVYITRGMAGQTLSVSLSAKHPQAYFNVTPLGSQEAMFIGSTSGNTMRRRLPVDGDYRVDVYLMRAAARRGSASPYKLTTQVVGYPLRAISADRDALVAGTPFHATAQVACAMPYSPAMTTCDAGVIRRGINGTATAQIRWPQGVFNVLFVKGVLADSDSAQPIKASRHDERTILRIGKDAVVEIPDPLLKGG